MGMTGHFIFDDIDTRTYTGIYVAFDDIDKTPNRVYEEVEIPARNGKLYIDKNRYEDVEHTYHIIATTKANGSALINALASKVGYYKLQDSFNTGEYYQAVFTSGAEVNITPERDTNKFKITFTRKPQRWLTSGETAVSVSSGGKVTNPTLFDAKPQLQVWGYGDINLGNRTITLENSPIGDILLANKTKNYSNNTVETLIQKEKYNVGDVITVGEVSVYFRPIFNGGYYSFTSETIADSNNSFVTTYLGSGTDTNHSFTSFNHLTKVPVITFTAGTAQTVTNTVSISGVVNSTNVSATAVQTIEYIPNYSATEDKIAFTLTNITLSGFSSYDLSSAVGQVNVNSTVSSHGAPTYIDLDIGEAYIIENGTVISVNNGVQIPAELPTLPPGDTTVTYDNTVTQLKVQPRWWKV